MHMFKRPVLRFASRGLTVSGILYIVCICIWAFDQGGGGAFRRKVGDFQFSPVFSKMSFCRGRCVIPF